MDAEQVADAYRHAPLHHQPYIEREVDIARRTEGVSGIDVHGTSDFHNHIDNHHGDTQPDDFLVVGQEAEDEVPRSCPDAREYERHQNGKPHYVLAQKVGGTDLFLSYQVSDGDGTSLRHGDGKEVDKHHDVDRIGTGGKGIVA